MDILFRPLPELIKEYYKNEELHNALLRGDIVEGMNVDQGYVLYTWVLISTIIIQIVLTFFAICFWIGNRNSPHMSLTRTILFWCLLTVGQMFGALGPGLAIIVTLGNSNSADTVKSSSISPQTEE